MGASQPWQVLGLSDKCLVINADRIIFSRQGCEDGGWPFRQRPLLLNVIITLIYLYFIRN